MMKRSIFFWAVDKICCLGLVRICFLFFFSFLFLLLSYVEAWNGGGMWGVCMLENEMKELDIGFHKTFCFSFFSLFCLLFGINIFLPLILSLGINHQPQSTNTHAKN